MLKKTITFTDFSGEENTRDFYFNLSKAEMTDLQIGTTGTFSAQLQRVIDSKDSRQILDTFKNFIRVSYGERTPDGRGFLKTDEGWANFAGSGAYDTLYLEFFENPDLAAAFVRGIMPSEIVDQIAAQNTPNGFRPGSEMLPKSRRDALAAEQVENANPVVDTVPTMSIEDVRELEELRALRNAQLTAVVPDVQQYNQ